MCQHVGQLVLQGKLKHVSELWVSKVQHISLFSILRVKVSSILSQILLNVDLIVSVFAEDNAIETKKMFKIITNKQKAY